MTEPTTPTGKHVWGLEIHSENGRLRRMHILAIESEAAAAERERLRVAWSRDRDLFSGFGSFMDRYITTMLEDPTE